jgi:preprotein translocase subunit SecG
MFTVVLIIQIMVTIALVGVILLQRSEGGALGMGGGGGGGGGAGGLMTGRSAANLLTRTTTILAATFFATSILLTIIAKTQGDNGIEFGADGTATTGGSGGSISDMLGDDLLIPGDATVDDVPPVENEVPADDGPVVPDAD